MSAASRTFWCPWAFLPNGWTADVRIACDSNGGMTDIRGGASPEGCISLQGYVIPGMPNLHSHAFQRAMAGLTERPGTKADGDDFWSWRKTMYSFVGRLDPDQIEAIATHLYVEMLKAGYTGVAEFHYMHNAPGGRTYDDPAELSRRICQAASAAGLRLTLLPVLYQDGGFGGRPAGVAQQRFRLETDAWATLIQTMTNAAGTDQTVGAALHSLRAVSPAALDDATAAFSDISPTGPIHIHIAEQQKEVADCLAWSGERPVTWLLENTDVDGRWVLIHATHMTDEERLRAARTGAVAGLCPTTEANLGDGLFPFPEWMRDRAIFGVGSDSNVSLDPREELRWLEYGQRLNRQRRIVSMEETGPSTSLGGSLWAGAARGGAKAMGQPVGALTAGRQADFLVLDPDHPTLAGHQAETILDAWIFTNAGSALKDVWVSGRQVIEGGRHPDEAAIAARYAQTLHALLSEA